MDCLTKTSKQKEVHYSPWTLSPRDPEVKKGFEKYYLQIVHGKWMLGLILCILMCIPIAMAVVTEGPNRYYRCI